MTRFASAVLGALALLLPLAPAAADTLSPDAFTRRFAETLNERDPALSVTIAGEMELRIVDAAGDESAAFLDNAYRDYLADPAALSQILGRHADVVVNRPKDADNHDRSAIVPIIKDRGWLKEATAALEARGDEPPQPVFEALNDELVILYAFDYPTHVAYLIPENLEELSLERSELRALAVENLGALLSDIQLLAGEDILMLTAGGDYDASLLLLDDVWSSGQIEVEGEIVVAIPARDALLITGSENAAGMAELRKLATAIRAEASYALTDTLFVYREGGFARLRP